MIAEEWREVTGYKYEVSNRGRVRSSRRVRATRTHRDGHIQVTLHKDGTRKTFYVHVLVLEAFVGPRPKGYQTCHNDGDPSNNCVYNLRWDTQASNYNDRRKHGCCNSGERHGKARLTCEDVREIRRRVGRGETQQKVADYFKTRQNRISEIVNYKTWKEI